jgi:RHS repeat-associated protein
MRVLSIGFVYGSRTWRRTRLATIVTVAVLVAGLLPVVPLMASTKPGPLPPVLTPKIDPSAVLGLGATSSPAAASEPNDSTFSASESGLKVGATEIVSRRTAYSDTYDNHDGTYTARVSAGPINYLDPATKNYEPTDTTLLPKDSQGARVRASHMATPVEVGAPDDSSGFISVDTGAGLIRLSLAPGATPGKAGQKPVTSGSEASVAGLMSGIDLEALVDPTGVRTFFVLNSRPSSSSFSVALDPGGLTPALQADGSIRFLDTKGNLAASMPVPYAVDSNIDPNVGSGKTTTAVSYALAKSGKVWVLTVAVDSSWLATATYPVYVDPSVIGTSQVWNNTVNSQSAYSNSVLKDMVLQTGYHEFLVGYDGASQWASYLKFDLAAAGITGPITAASLDLYPWHQWYGTSSGERTWVKKVATSWDTDKITWNNAPFHASPYPTSDASFVGLEAQWSQNANWTNGSLITTWARDWQASSLTNYGIYLYGDQSDYHYWKRFISSQNGTTNRPYLDVTYVTPTVTALSPTGGAWAKSLSWTYSNPGGPSQTQSDLQVSTSSTNFGSPVYDSGQVANTASSWPPTGLTTGATYYWHAKAYDGYTWSAWSTAAQFRWDPTGPALTVADNCATVGGCSRAGNTIYFQPGAAKTINLTATASDPNSGLASICFATLTAPANWTYTAGCGSTSTQTKSIGWSATSGQTSLTVTATDAVGNATPVTLTFVPTNPNQIVADFATPNEGVTIPLVSTGSYSVAWTESDTGGPGIGTRSLQRQNLAIVEPGVCPTGTYQNDGSPWTTSSPKSETALAFGYCYRWVLTLTDLVGNTATFASGLVLRDASTTLGSQNQLSFESWSLGGGDQASVNVVSGNLVVTHPIASLPIRGSSVSLGLTYNSLDPSDVGLGIGWRLDVQRRLTLNADNTVTLIDADGARYLFTAPQPNGSVTTYTRPAALFATLVKDTSQAAEFTLTYKDLSRDKFDISGSQALLVRQEDRHGNGVTIAYNAGTNDIATVTDTAATRVIDFTWDTAATPHRLTQIQDWAWIDGSSVVQTTQTGARRTYRLFYDGTGSLIGWSDPLATAGSCPSGGSHLTCVSYTAGLLSAMAKTQTYTTFSNGALGSATRLVSTSFADTGSAVTSVTDALSHQTTFDRSSGSQTIVHRPATGAVRYTFSSADLFGRTTSIFRTLGAIEIEQRTVWDTALPTLASTVTDNYGAALSTPARTVTYAYVAGSMGNLQRHIEPVDASTDRWTDYTYNSNNDVTQTIVSNRGSTSERTITRSCYSTDCSLTGNGLDLVAEIQNYVVPGPTNNETNVRTDYQYDAYGQRIRTTRHNRNAAGDALDDRLDASTYDASTGDLTREIVNYADGGVTAGDDVTPDSNGARTDLTTAYTFDTAGNQVSVADPRRAILVATGAPAADDYVTRSSFDALNQQVSETTPTTPGVVVSQKTSTMTYDESGAVRTATDFNGIPTGTQFNQLGSAVAAYEVYPAPIGASETSAFTYDDAGRIATSKDARQVASSALGYAQYAYDDLGQQTTVTEAAGSNPDKASTTITGYDGLGRKISETRDLGSSTYAFDLGGRNAKIDDGFTCSINTFDFQDRQMTATTGLDGGICTDDDNSASGTANAYDGLGRLTQTQVTLGENLGDLTVDDIYDSAGDRLSASTTKASVVTTSISGFNILGQLQSSLGADGATSKANYDPAGAVTDSCLWAASLTVGACYSVGTTPWPNPPTKVTTSAYDAENHVIATIDAATGMITTYDSAHGYAVLATYLPTGGGHEYQTYYTYDGKQRVTQLVHQDCLLTTGHSCAAAPQTVTIGSDEIDFDVSDNRTRVEEFNGTSTSERYYCYDAKNQLVGVKSGSPCATSPDETYTYDDSGNRLSSTAAGVTTNFAYDEEGRLCAVGATTCSSPNVTYDDAGRTQTYNGWFYDYDSAGRLTAACHSASCTGSGFDRVDYTYDGEGKRASTRTTNALGVVSTTIFAYQAGLTASETVGGTQTRSYVAASGTMVQMTNTDGGSTNNYVVTWNAHGDASSLNFINTDGSISPVNSYSYSTWGAPTTTVASGATDVAFRLLYVGSGDVQWDNDFGLGLEYVHARTYSPSLGRFVQPDPSRSEANAYVYTRNNPASAVDVNGYETIYGTEWAVCFSNPRACLYSMSSGAMATAIASRFYGGYENDAMRHCMWSCMSTFYIGQYWAWRFTEAHELGASHNGWATPDRRMDEHNNAIGRIAGAELWRIVGFMGVPWAALHICARSWELGYLYTIKGGRVYWSTGKLAPVTDPIVCKYGASCGKGANQIQKLLLPPQR